MKSIIFALLLLTALPGFAGVYGNLEFGDDRDTVTRKLQKSKLVTQTINTTLLSRTGLNGVFKSNTQLAGLTYHLYFGWDDNGGMQEVTLQSDPIEKTQYNITLHKAWLAANQLFTQVYNAPAQNAKFPNKKDVATHNILMTHIWHKGKKQSILMGPGIEKDNCFLAIRFINQHIEPVIIPDKTK